MSQTIQINRIEVANQVLASFARTAHIERRIGGWYVCWEIVGKPPIACKWQVRGGQDFYPVWSNKWIGGGTSCTALSQLVRWLRKQPVFPIATWRYWATDRVKLVTNEAVDILLAGGYPETVVCVLCGQEPKGLDWWSVGRVTGPCCGWGTGCNQKGTNGL